MRPLFTVPLLCLSLAACIPMPPTAEPTSLADLSQCGGNALHVLVGQPATTLPDRGGWGTLRVIKPGMMVTMDYSASRLNVHVDDADRILALDCG
jgi:hypothetical protein